MTKTQIDVKVNNTKSQLKIDRITGPVTGDLLPTGPLLNDTTWRCQKYTSCTVLYYILTTFKTYSMPKRESCLWGHTERDDSGS